MRPHRTQEQISRNMSRIRGCNTGIELALRRELWRRRLHYRKNVASLPGKPDVVFAKYKLAIFCDGEFWHGRNWRVHRQDFKKNRVFWIAKIERNMKRDRMVSRKLRSMGWTVLRFWETDIKRKIGHCVDKIEAALVDSLLSKWRTS